MSYTPFNVYVYLQAFSGAVAGLLGQSTPLTSARGAYTDTIAIAGAWAQEVDTQWGVATNPDLFEYDEILTFSNDLFEKYNPQPEPESTLPATYTATAQALMTILNDAEVYLEATGVTPLSLLGKTSSLVFRPGGVATGNVYTTWASLYAALNVAAPVSPQGNRPPTIVQIDDSVISPAVIPAGAYNLDSVTLTSVANFNNDSGGAALNIASGVTISAGILILTSFLQVTFLGAAACLTCSGAAQELNLIVRDFTILTCTGAGPFIACSNGFTFVEVGDGGEVGDGTHAVLAQSGAGTIAVRASVGSLFANAVTGAGANVSWAAINPGAQGAGVSVVQTLAYVPGTPGNWTAAAPAQVKSAIDRLAAAVEGLLGHAIP